MKINVNIIRVWHGDRHKRLRDLWRHWACLHSQEANLHWFENIDAKLDHVPCYEAIWKQEVKRPERFAIFTEHDFIPGPAFLYQCKFMDPDHPVTAAPYCTRNQQHELHVHDRPGAWYILVDKWSLKSPYMYFKSGALDTCNNMALPLERYGQKLNLTWTRDAYPEHYGLDVLDRYGALIGTHLFWSRHYNDPPGTRVCGFDLDEIRAKIDKVIRNAEAWHPATGPREATIPVTNLEADREADRDTCPPADRPQ